MTKIIIVCLSVLGFISLFWLSACRKKESGICYCSYYSGDRTHYDLRSLSKQQQIDSCNRLDQLASGFAGSCKLKK